MESERELGRSVYSRYLDVPPGETRTLRVSLTGRIDAAPRHSQKKQMLYL